MRETVLLETKETPVSWNMPCGIDGKQFSSVSKLIRVTALVLKFIRKLKKCDSSKGCFLNSEKLIRAETLWMKAV